MVVFSFCKQGHSPMITPNLNLGVVNEKKVASVGGKMEILFQVFGDTYDPRGVLRYISDGNVRSPFLGFEICDLSTFLGLKFCSDFFWVRDFGKDFFGG